MPLRRLDVPYTPAPCAHPEHGPPAGLALPPGRYEWSCPACGRAVPIVVPEPACLRQLAPGEPLPLWARCRHSEHDGPAQVPTGISVWTCPHCSRERLLLGQLVPTGAAAGLEG